MQSLGKSKRLRRIFSHPSGKIVIVPLDDSLLAGPTNGLEDLHSKALKIIEAKPNAIIGFQGFLSNFFEIINDVPTILNITASSTNSNHTKKVLVGSVELGVMLGVEAIAVHVNISSKYESSMLKLFGEISLKCGKLGMPLLGIMYPRKENLDGSDENYLDLKENERKKYTQLVAHSVRIGAELGADLIKTQYTGDPESFEFVVQSCKPIPVVAAGGKPIEIKQMLTMAEGVIKGGGAGVSFGRNIFSKNEPAVDIAAIKKIVYDGFTAEEAMSFLEKYKINNHD